MNSSTALPLNFPSISRDVLSFIIMNYMTINEIIDNGRVAKQWNAIVRSKPNWKQKLLADFGAITNDNDNPEKIYRHLTFAKFRSPRLFRDINNYVINTALNFSNGTVYLPVFGEEMSEMKVDPQEVRLYCSDAITTGNIELILNLHKAFNFDIIYGLRKNGLPSLQMNIATLFERGCLSSLQLFSLPTLFLNYNKIFYCAAKSGSIQLVKILLQTHPGLCEKECDMISFLSCANSSKNFYLMQFLLEENEREEGLISFNNDDFIKAVATNSPIEKIKRAVSPEEKLEILKRYKDPKALAQALLIEEQPELLDPAFQRMKNSEIKLPEITFQEVVDFYLKNNKMHVAKWLLDKYADDKKIQESKTEWLENLKKPNGLWDMSDAAEDLLVILPNIFKSSDRDYFLKNIFGNEKIINLTNLETKKNVLIGACKDDLNYLQWILSLVSYPGWQEITLETAVSYDKLNIIKWLLDLEGGNFKGKLPEEIAKIAIAKTSIETLAFLSNTNKICFNDFTEKDFPYWIAHSPPVVIEWLLEQCKERELTLSLDDFFTSEKAAYIRYMSPAMFVYLSTCHNIELKADEVVRSRPINTPLNLIEFSIFTNPANSKTSDPELLQTLLQTRFYKEQKEPVEIKPRPR